MKIDLKDTTFLIPVRLDTIERLENLLVVTKYILRNFECSIMVLEAAPYNNGLLKKLLDKRIKYDFIEDYDNVFYRTKYLNQMTQKVTTSFLGIWDSDVIIPKEQIVSSLRLLRSDKCDIIYPYGGRFLEMSTIIRNHYLKNNNIKLLKCNVNKMQPLYGENMTGGAILVNTGMYRKSGMENENFYGWGPEDLERYERWKNLGFRIFRMSGYLFHLTHPRGMNSAFRNKMQGKNTNKELFIIQNSSKEELEQYKIS